MKKNIYQSIACPVVAVALTLMGSLAVFGQGTYTATYLGGSGVWEQDFTNWDTIAYPNNGHAVIIGGNPYPDGNPFYNVVIDLALPCTLETSVNVESVNVANGSTLNLLNNVRLNVAGPLMADGLITLNATSGHLRVGDGSGVGATGMILMSEQRPKLYLGH